jgi:serine/threonine protein kinase
MHETRFPEGMVKAILTELLQALDFLHTECKAVHTCILSLRSNRLIHPGS